MSLVAYVKAAFLNRWNLLAFLGGIGFAMLSGYPDALLPIVAAGEIAYIGMLASHPKFQKYVDARESQSEQEKNSQASQQTLEHILRILPKDLLARFRTLRSQCVELRQIASELKQPGAAIVAPDAPLDQIQTAGLDRLLWVHLRLLYTQYALGQFLKRTSADQIQKTIAGLEQQLAQLPPDGDDPRQQRVRAALQDNLETNRGRLANLTKAQENYQMVQLEIDRLENKIRSLSEMAVNRQEPEFISGEVDHVASSMVATERTMNELQFATGLTSLGSEPPDLMQAKVPVLQ